MIEDRNNLEDRNFADRYPLQTIAACIALYLAAAVFLNRYWGSALFVLAFGIFGAGLLPLPCRPQ